MLTFGELFAGIGGIGLGLENTGGFKVKWQVERDKYASKVLAKHWPDAKRFDDVREFPATDGVDYYVDLIAGGFPCQDISVAGKGEGLKGERSGLFYEIVRIAERLKPKYLLLENVAALLIRGMDDVLGALAEIGYNAEWHCIPAAAIGAYHRRDRVFIIAHSKHDGSHGIGANEQKRECEEMGRGQLSRGDGGNGKMADADSVGQQKRPQKPVPYLPNISRELMRSREDLRRFWAVEPSLGRVADGVPRRVDRLRCLGNAVVPQVAQFVGEMILKAEQCKVS